MHRSLEAIDEQLRKLKPSLTLIDAARIDEVFRAHPDFWVDPEADRRLRTALVPELERLLGSEGDEIIELADSLIRSQAGVPAREEDLDPIYRDYRKRAGEVLMLPEDDSEIQIIGPCPASPFRWAIVRDLKTEALWPMSWVVINGLKVKGACQ